MCSSTNGRESELVAAGNTNPPGSAWAVVVLTGPLRQVQGVVGPFRTPGYAQAYASARCLADWLIVPALFLTTPPGPGHAGVAVL